MVVAIIILCTTNSIAVFHIYCLVMNSESIWGATTRESFCLTGYCKYNTYNPSSYPLLPPSPFQKIQFHLLWIGFGCSFKCNSLFYSLSSTGATVVLKGYLYRAFLDGPIKWHFYKLGILRKEIILWDVFQARMTIFVMFKLA